MINRVLIIEDDPMVAMLNQEFLLKIMPQVTILTAKSISEAIQLINTESIDLLLVDVYLPDGTGLEFLEELYLTNKIPSILITAANDDQSVKQALKIGVVDYLIKPFKFDRFESAIHKVSELYKLQNTDESLNQRDLDQYFSTETKSAHERYEQFKEELPKGLTAFTLSRLVDVLLQQKSFVSTKEMAEQTDISRITIKKYIDYLLELNYIDEEISYLEQGRPLTKYRAKGAFIKELEAIKR